MATNAKNPVVDDDTTSPEDILRKAKYPEEEVETSKEEDETTKVDTPDEETEEDGEEEQNSESQDEDSEETDTTESDEEASDFVKEFPNIKGDSPEEYARNLEIAYKNSTAEALRQKALAEANTQDTDVDIGETDLDSGPVDPRLLYLDTVIEREIQESYKTFSKSYPQTQDPQEYAKFQDEAHKLSQYIVQTQKRVAPASELYSKVAAILGWKPETVEPDSKDKLNAALKDRASTSKTTSASKPKSTSKVTDSEVAVAKQMGGWTDGKSDAEIRKELESVK